MQNRQLSSSDTLLQTAIHNVNTLVTSVFEHTPKQKAIIVYDTRSTLSNILYKAYKTVLADAQLIDFDTHTQEEILSKLDTLEALDFVVLIQSTSFRLNAFRLRVELFKRKIKVLEHPHLSRMADEEAPYYIDALEYDAEYTRQTGRALKEKIDNASSGVIDSGDAILHFEGSFENAKLNIGDYSAMVNTGGQFPIGEVFTEAKELTALNGKVKIFCFGDIDYKINYPKTPITLIVKEGQVVACENSTPAFDNILSNIRRDEETVWIRELGFGLNRALTKTKTIADTGSYERMCGVHISLGKKHGMYGKPGFKRRDGIYHVDVFIDTDTLTLGDEVIYKNGAWSV